LRRCRRTSLLCGIYDQIRRYTLKKKLSKLPTTLRDQLPHYKDISLLHESLQTKYFVQLSETMPETRRDRDRRLKDLARPPAPEMSESAVSFSVSQQYPRQQSPGPIRRSKALCECLAIVRKCVGEEIAYNARLTIAPTAMATGPYGQETSFLIDHQYRDEGGHTVSEYARAAEEVEATVWGTEEGVAANKRRIQRTIDQHEGARQVLEHHRLRTETAWVQLEKSRIPPSPTTVTLSATEAKGNERHSLAHIESSATS
jgi:hypothetical protein